MPIDGLMLSAIVRQLSDTLTGGRIDRIQQPERDEIHMLIRAGGKNHKLLMSSSANNARIHITQQSKKSMEVPPQLCTLLRKHILNGRVVSISQIGLDRIAKMTVESADELGDYTLKHIYVEIMGRHSNIIFTNDEGIIIDSARRVTADISRVREVLPHLRYELPPGQEKINAIECSQEEIKAQLEMFSNQTLDKAILNSLSGVSQQASRELSYRFFGDERTSPNIWNNHIDSIAGDIKKFFDELSDNISPVIFERDGAAVDVNSFVYHSRPSQQQIPKEDPSRALDDYFYLRDKKERIHQKSYTMHNLLANALERCEKKLGQQLEKQQEVENKEQYRIYGELITASLYAIKKGAKSAKLVNYYEEDMPEIEIPLDEKLSPNQNAQKYFKLYQKAKAAQALLYDQIRENREEIEYISGQLVNLENITEENELNEMRAELVKFGYIRNNPQLSGKKNVQKIPETRPMEYTSPSGIKIYVGKNNTQNDRLTFSADGNDYWLHTKDIPGSHVIIRLEGKPLDDQTLVYAARIAAKYSKAKNSSQVPVDYVQRKYVKKPSGAKPGFVVFTNNKTLYVDPLDENT
ncbi:MAG: NFACT family protein [Clostridia bacterium]|nr:NFACT family protein [Clostridia bacterium]